MNVFCHLCLSSHGGKRRLSLSPTDPASGTSANRIRVDSPPIERKLQYFARIEGLLLLYFALVDFNCHYQRHSV